MEEIIGIYNKFQYMIIAADTGTPVLLLYCVEIKQPANWRVESVLLTDPGNNRDSEMAAPTGVILVISLYTVCTSISS